MVMVGVKVNAGFVPSFIQQVIRKRKRERRAAETDAFAKIYFFILPARVETEKAKKRLYKSKIARSAQILGSIL